MSKLQLPSLIKHAKKDNKTKHEKVLLKNFIGFIVATVLLILTFVMDYFSRGIYKHQTKIVFYVILSAAALIMLILTLILYLTDVKKTVGKSYEFFDLTNFILVVVSLIFFAQLFVITITEVDGRSMEETLHHGDKVLVSQLIFKYKTDDIVVLRANDYINDSNTETNRQDYYVKRIKGVSGDKIKIINDNGDKYLSINDKDTYPLGIASVVVWENIIEKYDGVVPKDKYILIGDNSSSHDSKYFGLVDKKDILGRVKIRFYQQFGVF